MYRARRTLRLEAGTDAVSLGSLLDAAEEDASDYRTVMIQNVDDADDLYVGCGAAGVAFSTTNMLVIPPNNILPLALSPDTTFVAAEKAATPFIVALGD